MIDSGKLDRENLRELLPQLDQQSSYGLGEGSETSDWSGVSANKQGRITALDVTNRGLSGELPAALGDVSHLEHLHATSNCFDGEPLLRSYDSMLRNWVVRYKPVFGKYLNALVRTSDKILLQTKCQYSFEYTRNSTDLPPMYVSPLLPFCSIRPTSS